MKLTIFIVQKNSFINFKKILQINYSFILYFVRVIFVILIYEYAATLFGQILRLEPVRGEKKAMWEREMEWFISVSDHIVELAPTWQTLPDGTKREVQFLKSFIFVVCVLQSDYSNTFMLKM